MTQLRHAVPTDRPDRHRMPSRVGWAAAAGTFAVALVLAGCSSSPASDDTPPGGVSNAQGSTTEQDSTPEDESAAEPDDAQAQEETCDWDSPKISGPAEAPAGQSGELPEILVGSWQHTHTDEGSGFQEVTNDHRYVFTSPDRMLYCQHVPGATEYAENGADIVLNGTVIELPGGKYSYTVTAWDEDTLTWDNPVGGGYVYLLQRR